MYDLNDDFIIKKPDFFDEKGKLYPEYRGEFVPQASEIDLDGIEKRVVSLPAPCGIYSQIIGLENDRVMWVSYQSHSSRVGFGDAGMGEMGSDDEDDEHNGRLTVLNLKTLRGKPLEVDGSVHTVELSCNGSYMAVLAEDEEPGCEAEYMLFVSRAGEAPGSAAAEDSEDEDSGPEFGPMTGAVDIDGRVVVLAHPASEWPQLLHEAWRAVRDNYAEPGMGGVDWAAVRERWAAVLPRAGTRVEVADILSEMVADLSKSHTYEDTGDEGPRGERKADLAPGCLGADFAWDASSAGYRCVHVVEGDRWDPVRGGPLGKPGVNVQVGDVLVAVNGQALTEAMPPARALLGCGGQEVALTWRQSGGTASASGVDGVTEALSTLFLNDSGAVAAAVGAGSPARGGAAAAVATLGGPSASKKKKKKGGGGGGAPQSTTTPYNGGVLRQVTVRALMSDRYARYVDGVASRRRTIHSQTDGRIGYCHIPDCERKCATQSSPQPGYQRDLCERLLSNATAQG